MRGAHGQRPVRSGRRTKLLVKHLVRGDIALIDHLDIDRVSAEELIAAGVVAVLNCRASSSGHLPEPRPAAARRGGHRCSSTCPTTRCSTRLADGDPLVDRRRAARPTDRRRGAARRGELLARGEVLDLERVRAETERAAQGDRRGARALRAQHDRAHARGARAARRADSSCRASPPTSATARRSSSCAASTTSATCARCARSSATCAR